MTTDTAAQLDLVRQQRDHAEAEVHRLTTALTDMERLLTANAGLCARLTELEQIERRAREVYETPGSDVGRGAGPRETARHILGEQA